MSRIGPTLPPHLTTQCQDSSSDEEDAYGPALPPHLQNRARVAYDANEPGTSSKDEPCQSEDDEVIGPLPIEASNQGYSASSEVESRALQMKRKLLCLEDQGSVEPKREEWMIELPELNTKNFGLGPRTFNRAEKPECTGREEWTLTPKSLKLEPKEGKKSKEHNPKTFYLEKKRNEELEKIVSRHNEHKRSKSLLSIHEKELKRRRKEEEAKPKERKPFDRDVDLKANQIDDAKRKALIKKSQELNTKFKTGNQKFL